MKKTVFMVAAVALAMTACNKEEINNNEGAADSQVPSVVVEFTASLNDAPAKTTLDIASNKTHWVGGDAISINGVKFTTAEEGASVRFTNAEELPTDFSAPYIAKYPYTASGNLEIPAAQDAVIGNFDADAVAAVAYSTDNTLAFKNATSLLKFQVPEACSSVTLTSDEALAGALTITNPAEDDGLPIFSAEEKSVTISGSFVAGNDYYVAVLPGVKNNFVVRIDGYLSRTAESVNIARSTIADMKTLPKPVASDVEFNVGSTRNTMFVEGNYSVLKNFTFKSTDTYKVVYGDNWVRGIANTTPINSWCYLYKSDGDMSGLSGSYDIYIDKTNSSMIIIDAGTNVPENTIANRTLYFMYQNKDWKGLYAWYSAGKEIFGGWNDCATNRLGTSKTPAGTECSYWAFPSSYNDLKIQVIVRNADYSVQSHDTEIELKEDIEAWQDSWTDGKAKLGQYKLTRFAF